MPVQGYYLCLWELSKNIMLAVALRLTSVSQHYADC